MATFTYTPTYAVYQSVTPRVLQTEFGDGYTQRTGDGLNTQRQIWNVEFVSDTTTINNIVAFLEATNGSDSFDWTPPRQSSALKFRYTEYARQPMGPTTDKLTATFRQEFDLS
jgi:phage-related protein